MALTRIGGKALPSGSVIQTTQSIYNTHNPITSTSYVDTGVSGSITPRFADSQVLVRCAVQMGCSHANGNEVYIKMMRGSTEIETYERPIHMYDGGSPSGNPHMDSTVIFEFLDSPATTSSTTYKLQAKVLAGGRIRINDYAVTATGSASMITLQEITA